MLTGGGSAVSVVSINPSIHLLPAVDLVLFLCLVGLNDLLWNVAGDPAPVYPGGELVY